VLHFCHWSIDIILDGFHIHHTCHATCCFLFLHGIEKYIFFLQLCMHILPVSPFPVQLQGSIFEYAFYASCILICLLNPGYFSSILCISAVCPFLGATLFLPYVPFRCSCSMHILYLFPLHATLNDVSTTDSCFKLDLIVASIQGVQISPSFSFA